jgi:hypothetical protein
MCNLAKTKRSAMQSLEIILLPEAGIGLIDLVQVFRDAAGVLQHARVGAHIPHKVKSARAQGFDDGVGAGRAAGERRSLQKSKIINLRLDRKTKQ